VGSGEILVIALIALVVLGPEKLPKLAADIGRWVGRARAMARQLRSQLDQEVHLEELRRLEQRAADGVDAAVRSKPAPPATPEVTPSSTAAPADAPAPAAAPAGESAAATQPATAPTAMTQPPADGQP
jgi:sec-independent protein translocase protein TatB